jgi:hypothetical protein
LPRVGESSAEPTRSDATARPAAFAPTPAAPDVPACVGGFLFAAYSALVAAFAVAAAGSAQSIYAIAICALFVLMFFAVPRIFLLVEPRAGHRPTLERFMREGMQTLTGHSNGRDALVQMLIVPVFLTLGALGMGIAAVVIM